MPGASISRWTMAYFAAALGFLLAALGLMVAGFGLPFPDAGGPDTLVVVHLVTIGWLGLLFCGALLQFVPVLAATHLRLAGLALPALVLIVCGLLLLLAGFLGLGGRTDIDPTLLPMAAVLLTAGFCCVGLSIVATVAARKEFGVPGILVLAGLGALGLTVALGGSFTLALSDMAVWPWVSALLAYAVPLHAASGLLGWMTLTAIGVSYKLFAMFMLSPESPDLGRAVIVVAMSALAVLGLALGLGLIDGAGFSLLFAAAPLMALAAAALYCNDIRRLFLARRRKALELNSQAGLAALVFLPAGLALLAGAAVSGNEALATSAFYLLGLGWLTGLGLAQLYKIVPFLTWLETYGTVMGKAQVPRVQDLVEERRARAWFALFYPAVALGGVAILFGSPVLFRLASAAEGVAVAALVFEYLRARRLDDAPAHLRLPAGAVRPHLIYAITHQKD